MTLDHRLEVFAVEGLPLKIGKTLLLLLVHLVRLLGQLYVVLLGDRLQRLVRQLMVLLDVICVVPHVLIGGVLLGELGQRHFGNIGLRRMFQECACLLLLGPGERRGKQHAGQQ